MAGGWNQRIPPGVARCTCAARRVHWAMLSPQMNQPCCTRSCCQARVSAVMCTREEVWALRGQAVNEGWTCPRCGEPIAAHWRGFECLDQSVKRLRAQKGANRVR